MLRCLFFIITALLLSSCAKPPLQELNAAEYMVGRAYAKQAPEFAPAEYQAARTALNDARAAMQDSDYGDARDSLDFSLQHARRAVVLTEEAQARRLKEEKKQARTVRRYIWSNSQRDCQTSRTISTSTDSITKTRKNDVPRYIRSAGTTQYQA